MLPEALQDENGEPIDTVTTVYAIKWEPRVFYTCLRCRRCLVKCSLDDIDDSSSCECDEPIAPTGWQNPFDDDGNVNRIIEQRNQQLEQPQQQGFLWLSELEEWDSLRSFLQNFIDFRDQPEDYEAQAEVAGDILRHTLSDDPNIYNLVVHIEASGAFFHCPCAPRTRGFYANEEEHLSECIYCPEQQQQQQQQQPEQPAEQQLESDDSDSDGMPELVSCSSSSEEEDDDAQQQQEQSAEPEDLELGNRL